MRITEIKYTRRVNLGNYEHAELEMMAVVSESDDHNVCAQKLKQEVEHALGLAVDPVKFEDIEEVAEGGDLKMKDGSTVKVDEKTEIAHEETPELPPVIEEKPKKKTKKKAAKKKAPTKEKTVSYDRGVKAHKDEFAAILNDRCPWWKGTDETKQRAKDLSLNLNGTPIFDSKGEVLGSFTDAIVEGMGEEPDAL